MSIYIGKTPISSAWSSVSATASNSSTPLILASDNKENFIQLQNFRFGQYKENNTASFQLYHSNVLLTNYSSNLLQHYPNSKILQNVAIQTDVRIGSNLTARNISSCNVTIYMNSGIPLRINSNNTDVFQIGLNGQTYFTCNLGIGVININPAYRLEVADSMRIQSNITVGKTMDTTKLNTNVIYGTDDISTRIEFNDTNIHLISANTIINNPNLVGNITYGATISLDQTTINQLEASNLQVANNKANQQAIYIDQLNIGGFANTATGNPLHVESYFSTPNKSIPIFVVDTLGRISSGKTTTNIPDPDYGYTYYIDKDRYPYLSGFFQYTSCNALQQMIINKQGYISIGSNQTQYPLQIVNPYTGYESNIPIIDSLIGLYQTGSNQYAYLQCYDCNQNIVLQITNTGKVLFGTESQYDASYQLEIQKRAYIRTLDTSNIFSTGGIDFMNSSLSNINILDTAKLYAQSGVMSNVFFNNLTVDNLNIDAFDYISKAPNYTEFRIVPERFLFYGSNLVMNPNPYFFEVEQTALPKDNVRIYANGGPTQGVNVIRTIGNNQQSQVRIYNCNDAVDSISRVILKANEDAFTFGVINLSTTPNGEAEGFITNNGDLTVRDRQLSINAGGIRIGEYVHFLKDGTTTIGYTTPGKRTLTVVGEAEFKNNAGQTALFIKDNGNIGIGTNTPRVGLELQSQTVYMSGNLGIGNLNPNYPVDVNGTVRATRVLGGFFDDVIGGSFSNLTPWSSSSTSNAYYISGNVGIGTTNPVVPFHLHSSNMDTRKHIEVGPVYYTGSWPPIASTFTQVVTSNVAATFTSNILAPFMPRYPPDYLTASSTTLSDKLYGNGTYVVTSSSTESGYDSYKAFDNSTSTYWASDSVTSVYNYNASSGAYQGTTILNGISGEWIKFSTPNTFALRKYIISAPARVTGAPDSTYDIVSPRSWTLIASANAGGSWTTLQTVTDGYIGTSSYTNTYHLNITNSYDVYALIVTQANASTDTYGQVAIRDLQFFEGSNQRSVSLGSYNTYKLVGNTSNASTIMSSSTVYNSGTYKVSMTSNYTQQSYLDLQYTFDTSAVPYTVTLTPNSYIQQSVLSGILSASDTNTFTTLSNAFISTVDTNPPLSLQLTYPTITDPILTYSIVGPSNNTYAPRKWTVLGSSDGISWTQINNQDSITWTTGETKTFTLTSPSTYSQYRYDFYRNNSATYAPLSIQRILTYGTLRTNIPSFNHTIYPSTISGYNQPPASNLSQLNISGSVIVGSNSMMSNLTPPNNSIIIDGSLGIGTTIPLRSLHVQGDTRIVGNMSNEGRLYIGTNSGGNIGGGIYFGGTRADTSYDHTVIENRTYVVSDIQKTELLFFKGNDTDSTSNGPDRIRMRAGEIRFDVYPTDTTDRYTECNVVMINSAGTMTVNHIMSTSNLMSASLQSRNSGVAAFYQYTYFSAGTYTLPAIPEYGCSQARIQMWGAGGGGAGGNIQGTINSAGTILGGAGGGGGGAYGEVILPYELLSNVTLTTTIGTGGAAGVYGAIATPITTTTNSTNATNGTAGTATTLTLTTNTFTYTTNSSNSSFSYTWTVNGGGGGSTSTTTTAGNLGAGGYPVTTANFTLSQKGGDGGRGGTANIGGGNGGALIGNGYAATGGGGGAGVPVANTPTYIYYSGGNSGNASKIESYLVGTTAFAYGDKFSLDGTRVTGITGRIGYSITDIYTGGTGGGGGYGTIFNGTAAYGYTGYTGGSPGGGGGGGASAREITSTSGNYINGYGGIGASGADGGLILTYY